MRIYTDHLGKGDFRASSYPRSTGNSLADAFRRALEGDYRRHDALVEEVVKRAKEE